MQKENLFSKDNKIINEFHRYKFMSYEHFRQKYFRRKPGRLFSGILWIVDCLMLENNIP